MQNASQIFSKSILSKIYHNYVWYSKLIASLYEKSIIILIYSNPLNIILESIVNFINKN